MIVNYIEKDPYKIKYPNRDATFYLNSPQFLNLLNDSGLDLDEQSKNLAKQQLMESQATSVGRGGVVDRAVDTGTTTAEVGTNVYEGQFDPLSVRRRRIASQLIGGLRRRMTEQENQRQAREDELRRQREAELKK